MLQGGASEWTLWEQPLNQAIVGEFMLSETSAMQPQARGTAVQSVRESCAPVPLEALAKANLV